MAAKLKRHGLLDRSEYKKIKMHIKSLKYLHKRDDLMFLSIAEYTVFWCGLGSVTRLLTPLTLSSLVVCITIWPNDCQISRAYLNPTGRVNMYET